MLPALVSKEQAAEYIGMKTPEAAEKRLARLGVKKYDFGLIGGKGIRYRLTDIDEALARIAVDPNPAPKKKRPKAPALDIFDLPIKEAVALLTARNIAQ